MRYAVVVGLVVVILSTSVALSSDGYCDPEENVPQLEFTLSDGTTTFIKLTDTTIATSTIVTEKGMTHESSVFNLGLDRMPTSITLHSDKGDFRISLTITTSDPGLTGMPMKLCYGEYIEYLTPSSGYSCTVPSSTSEWLSPNQKYQTSLYIDDGTGSYVPYDPPSGLKISMRWESSENTRFVRFFSDGDVVGSRFYNPGDKLGEFPEAPAGILPFTGWFDSEGKKVDSDTTYDYQGDMDFHTVYDIDGSTLLILILIALIMGICGMLITEKMD